MYSRVFQLLTCIHLILHKIINKPQLPSYELLHTSITQALYALELKLWQFEVFLCLDREAIRLQCFKPTHECDDHYQILSNIHYGSSVPACILWPLYESTYTICCTFFSREPYTKQKKKDFWKVTNSVGRLI